MTQTEFAKQILEKISSGHLKMLPKKKFILKMVLGVLGAVVLVLFAVFFLSLIIYVTRKTGAWHLPAMGFKGLVAFLFGGFPWFLVLCLLVFIGLLEYYFRQFSFAYRRAVLSISGVLLVGTILGAIFVEMSGLHYRLEKISKAPGVFKFGPMYEKFDRGFKNNSLFGTVEEVRSQGLLVMDADEHFGKVEVIFLEETRFPQGKNFAIGDRIFVGGQREGNKFKALGVKKEMFLPKKIQLKERGFPPLPQNEVNSNFLFPETK